jgi:hypothetical protein
VAGSYAYVVDGNSLRIIDVSDPTAPIETGVLEPSGSLYDVAVAGSYAYLANSTRGLRIIDVSDPADPAEVGLCDTPGNSVGVAVAGNYAYVADGSGGGLRIIDISDPAVPTEVGFYITYNARDVAVVANYAYVADGSGGGLRIIDVSDPANPIEVGSYGTPGTAEDVAMAGDYAYTANYYSSGGGTLHIIDISVPEAPAGAGFYDTPGFARGVAVSGCYVYVANHSVGLLVLRSTLLGYQASGVVELEDGSPLPGVTVSAGAGGETVTDASGIYIITGLITGTYTLTPTLTGHTFSPPTRTISVPPDGLGQDFEARPLVPAEADFVGGPTVGPPPLTVVFTNTSTGDYDTSLWLFGDGVTSTVPSPTHTYTAVGAYTVTLTVAGLGGTDTEVKERYITVRYGVYLPVILRSG